MASITNFADGNQNGAVSPPDSSPFRIPGKSQNYNIKLETNVESGNIKSSSITLQKEVTTKSGKEYQAYAVSYDGGKTWTDGGNPPKPVTTSSGLSKDELKALQPGGALSKKAIEASTKTAQKANANPKQLEQLKKGNDATTSPAPGNADQSKPTIDVSKELKVVNGTDAGLPGAGSAPLKYPVDMNARQDHILFTQVEYSPRALTDTTTNSEGNPLNLGKRSDNRKILGKVILPIQSGIMDGNNVSWADDRLNALQLFQINVMRSAITGGFKAAAETTGAAAKEFKSDFSTEKGSIANLINQAVTQKNVLARTEGSIVNDNLELLFQSPALRTFSFTFKLSAREAPEAKMIANIIRFFKQGMAPKRTPNAYFLKSPNTFLLEYRHDNKDHPGMNKIKECALTNCSVNYTPDGYYAAHTDGYLVTYDVTMQFQELEPVYNDEYAGLENRIGY